MGTYYIDNCNASRLYDANEANPSAENGSFTDWSVDDEFILALQVHYDGSCNKATVGSQFKLQFSEDGGGWVDVGVATAIAWGTNTTLVDDTAGTQKITVAFPAGCSGSFEGANENEGDNTLPDAGTIAVGTKGNWREFHWALNPANAKAGSVYTFQAVNITNSNTALAGAVASSITIAASADIDVSSGVSALNLATYSADVNAETEVDAGIVGLNLATYQADINAETEVDANIAGLILATYQADVNVEVEVDSGVIEIRINSYGLYKRIIRSGFYCVNQ